VHKQKIIKTNNRELYEENYQEPIIGTNTLTLVFSAVAAMIKTKSETNVKRVFIFLSQRIRFRKQERFLMKIRSKKNLVSFSSSIKYVYLNL
jgi:hypothetical protein